MLDFESQSKEWDTRLRSCQYAGEVVIAEDSLTELAIFIRPLLFSLKKYDQTIQTALLVLAINCMYYRHDEEGFWVHFCKLLNMLNSADTQSWLGEMLEAQLLHYGFLDEPGYGPFRYVTPLKKEAGITRREIPKFAEILTSLSSEYGLDGIRTIDKEDFSYIISRKLPTGHLSTFLRGESGWDFTRSVARNISQYHRSVLTIEELYLLSGYRSGFFKELFDEFGRPPVREKQKMVKPQSPRLVFLPENLQVALSFNQQFVSKRAYLLNDEVISNALYALKDEKLFKEEILGKRIDSNSEWTTWKIQGWNPNNNKIALFHVDYGYIDLTKGVFPGTYYMLGHYQNPPPDKIQLCLEPYIDIPFENYSAWLIEIDESTDLSFLGIEQDVHQVVDELIKWARDFNRLPGSSYWDNVFVGSLPLLMLSRAELFHDDDVVLFLEYEGKTEKIKIPKEHSSIPIPVSPSGFGRIWVEPKSHKREFAGKDTLGELSFILLPEFNIEWPDKLHKETDEPEIFLECPFEEVTLELKNAVPTDENHRKWKVKPVEPIIEGILSCNDISINLTCQIFRASIKRKDERQNPYILNTDLEHQTCLVATGIPHSDVNVYLLNNTEKVNLGQITFNSAGECHFDTYRIRDTLSNYIHPIGLFAIECEGELIPTSTYYLNFDWLYDWIVSSDEDEPLWFSIVSNPLRKVLTIIRKLRKERIGELYLLDPEDIIPKHIVEFYKVFCLSSECFDDALIPESIRNDRSFTASYSDVFCFLKWFKKAKDLSRADQIPEDINAEKLLEEYSNLVWTPPFMRWQELVRKILSYLKDSIDVTSLVDEWRKDVEKGYKKKYSSTIANQELGCELTEAWIRYRANNFDGAVAQIKSLIPQMSSPISDLAVILIRICWLRQAYFKSQPTAHYQNSNKKLKTVFNELTEIVDFGGNLHTFKKPDIPTLAALLSVLPLSANDCFVLKLFTKSGDFDNPYFSNDWLSCWFGLRLIECDKLNKKVMPISKVLKKLLNTIPASPDKRYIIETVEKY